MKTFFKILFLALVFTSCDDFEPAVYNSDEASSPTFLSFSRLVYTLPVEQNETGSVTVTLNSSTVSNVDRTYNIEIDEEASEADPETYEVPASITIPAGEYSGSIVITGEDNGVTTEILPFVFSLSNITDESMDSNTITVNVQEVCLLGASFTGNYRVNQLTDPLPVNGGITVFAENSIVNLAIGSSDYERIFSANVYPQAIDGAGIDFGFTLSCGATYLSEGIDTGIQCTADNTIKFSVAIAPSSFNADDDSQIDVTFTEDATSSCVSPMQTTIRFTKVD